MEWDFCQENADEILASGLLFLKNSKKHVWSDVSYSGYGNYLISQNKVFYIGEGKNLVKRLKLQFDNKTSTFYKTYKSKFKENASIDSFKVQYLLTNFGRKEIEEFGIVNLPTNLNKFQLAKKNKTVISPDEHIWLEIQNNHLVILRNGEIEVMRQKLVRWSDAILPDAGGVYLVYNSTDRLIYIGESSNISERHITHSEVSYFSALRRHIGTDILRLKFIDDKKRRFLEKDDILITKYLQNCKLRFLKVNIGRFELEESLIRKLSPLLNRKENQQ